MAPRTTKKRPQRGKARSKAIRRACRPPAGHLLVIECNAPRLAAEHLSLGTTVVHHLTSLLPNRRIELLRTSAKDQLAADFGAITERHSRFRTLLVVGHSNEQGLQLADGVFAEWAIVAKWLAPFEPKNILLAACHGARFEGAKTLFEELRSLQDVYGPPPQLALEQTVPLVLAAMVVQSGKRIPKDLKIAGQLLGFATTRSVIFQWTRQEILKKGNLEGHLWNSFADLLRAIFG